MNKKSLILNILQEMLDERYHFLLARKVLFNFYRLGDSIRSNTNLDNFDVLTHSDFVDYEIKPKYLMAIDSLNELVEESKNSEGVEE